jgi:hypothetical protein
MAAKELSLRLTAPRDYPSSRSGPSRKNRFRLHDLFGRTGETVSEFSGPVGDLDLDGIQAAVLHPQAELFVNFLEAVLLEAIAHAQASARAGHIAMLNAVYFEAFTPLQPPPELARVNVKRINI